MVVLDGANTYSGGTTKCRVGLGGRLRRQRYARQRAGDQDSGALIFDRVGAPFVVPNVIGGTGSVFQVSTGGTLDLNGANTFTGGATLSAGTTVAGSSSALGGIAGSAMVVRGATSILMARI